MYSVVSSSYAASSRSSNESSSCIFGSSRLDISWQETKCKLTFLYFIPQRSDSMAVDSDNDEKRAPLLGSPRANPGEFRVVAYLSGRRRFPLLVLCLSAVVVFFLCVLAVTSVSFLRRNAAFRQSSTLPLDSIEPLSNSPFRPLHLRIDFLSSFIGTRPLSEAGFCILANYPAFQNWLQDPSS